MKKIILLIISIFILTGCNAEYQLVYENDKLNETLKVTDMKSESFINDINFAYKKNYIVNYKLDLGQIIEPESISNYCDTYKTEIIDENEFYGLKLEHNYELTDDFSNSSIVNSLFENTSVSNNIILANNIVNIFDSYSNLREIKISFKTDKKVLETNADEVNDNIYYWYINQSNYKDKNIKIFLGEDKLLTSDGYISGDIIKYILMVVSIIFLLSIVVIYKKVKKSNN